MNIAEERFAALVDEVAGDPSRYAELLALLAEDHPMYAERGTAATVRMRGWILATLARIGVKDDALLFVLEELDTGVDAYLVAAAARALRAYREPRAAFAPLVMGALANIRYRDERVAFGSYGEYAVGRAGTTPVEELLATLTWLGPQARAVVAEVEALRDGGVGRKYRGAIDGAVAAIGRGEAVAEDCCKLPAVLSWPAGARKSSEGVGQVLLEDQDGNAVRFDALFRGHVSIVVFFYTRCDNPLKCSLTIAKLARVQQRLEERGLSAAIHTAAITYDPAFDVAERLRTYGRERGVRFAPEHRLLRSPSGLEVLRRHFALGVNFIESLVNRHRVEAYVLDREGRVAASFQRLRWDEDELVARAAAVMEDQRKLALPVLGTLGSLAFAFFPKCPVCWAAYLSGFGIAGLSRIPYAPWLAPAFAALMLLNVAAVWLRSRATRRMAGFYLVTAGTLAVLAALPSGAKSLAALGVLATMAGSVASAYSAFPRRRHKAA